MATKIKMHAGLKGNLTKEEITAMIAEEEERNKKKLLALAQKELNKIKGNNPLFNRGNNLARPKTTGQKYKVPF